MIRFWYWQFFWKIPFLFPFDRWHQLRIRWMVCLPPVCKKKEWFLLSNIWKLMWHKCAPLNDYLSPSPCLSLSLSDDSLAINHLHCDKSKEEKKTKICFCYLLSSCLMYVLWCMFCVVCRVSYILSASIPNLTFVKRDKMGFNIMFPFRPTNTDFLLFVSQFTIIRWVGSWKIENRTETLHTQFTYVTVSKIDWRLRTEGTQLKTMKETH